MERSSDFESSLDAFAVKLEQFEGPLDLLLHLCQKHELDILDIPISFVTAAVSARRRAANSAGWRN